MSSSVMRLQPFLHVGHRLVVHQRAQLFQEVAQQRAGGDIAHGLFHVFLEVRMMEAMASWRASLGISMVMVNWARVLGSKCCCVNGSCSAVH